MLVSRRKAWYWKWLVLFFSLATFCMNLCLHLFSAGKSLFWCNASDPKQDDLASSAIWITVYRKWNCIELQRMTFVYIFLPNMVQFSSVIIKYGLLCFLTALLNLYSHLFSVHKLIFTFLMHYWNNVIIISDTDSGLFCFHMHFWNLNHVFRKYQG